MAVDFEQMTGDERAQHERSPIDPTTVTPRMLGERLVADGLVSEHECKRALTLGERTDSSLVGLLNKNGLVAERDLAEALSRICGLPIATEESFPEVPIAEDTVSTKFLKSWRICPLSETDSEITVAMVDPTNRYLFEALKLATGKRIRPVLSTPSRIERALENLYDAGEGSMADIVEAIDESDSNRGDENIERLIDLASETPIVRLVNHIINRAIEMRASDIHIEPFERALKVRYRIDGVLQDADAPPARSKWRIPCARSAKLP